MSQLLDAPLNLHPDRPLPDTADPVMRPFWAGCREGRLVIQRDRITGEIHWPPKPAYWKGNRLEYIDACGDGTIFSWVVAYEPFLPAFKGMLPHILVIVELTEGPRLVGYMVHCRPEQMRFAMKVRVVFQQLTDDVTLPVWEPAE